MSRSVLRTELAKDRSDKGPNWTSTSVLDRSGQGPKWLGTEVDVHLSSYLQLTFRGDTDITDRRIFNTVSLTCSHVTHHGDTGSCDERTSVN